MDRRNKKGKGMKIILSILIAAVISYCIAAPVSQPTEPEPTNPLEALSTFKNAFSSELLQWRTLLKTKGASNIFFKDTLLPRIKKGFQLIDTVCQFPHLIVELHSIKKLVHDFVQYPLQIVELYSTIDDESVRIEALNHIEFSNLVQEFEFKYMFDMMNHRLPAAPLSLLNVEETYNGLFLIQCKEEGEIISKIYQNKITAEGSMLQGVEKLLKNLPSFEQIDQFFASYEAHSQVFKDWSLPVFRIEHESHVKLNGDSASETTLNTASGSKTQNENEESPNLISESASDAEPSSKRRKLNNHYPNIFDDSNPQNGLVRAAFPSFMLGSTVVIKEKLLNWTNFVKNNQPIDTSELLPALKDCITMMKKVEVFLPYSSFLTNDLDASFKVALQTADGFHDLLVDAVLLVLPSPYFDSAKEYLSEELREKLPGEFNSATPILPKEFFADPIFIEFCINYSHLLLQKNCHALRGKAVTLINLTNFVYQNRPFVSLIKTYQPILGLRSVRQTHTEGNDGIRHNLEAKALKILNESLHGFSHSPEGYEMFLKANRELIKAVTVENSIAAEHGDENFWMVHHVPMLLDFSPTDIRVNPRGNTYIKHDGIGEWSESRRLYTPILPLGSHSASCQI